MWMDQYHFLQLQTVKQNRGKSAREFLDAGRVWCQKTVLFSSDLQVQNIYAVDTEYRL